MQIVLCRKPKCWFPTVAPSGRKPDSWSRSITLLMSHLFATFQQSDPLYENIRSIIKLPEYKYYRRKYRPHNFYSKRALYSINLWLTSSDRLGKMTIYSISLITQAYSILLPYIFSSKKIRCLGAAVSGYYHAYLLWNLSWFLFKAWCLGPMQLIHHSKSTLALSFLLMFPWCS